MEVHLFGSRGFLRCKKWFVFLDVNWYNFLYRYTRVSAVHVVAEQWILSAARESVKTKPPIEVRTGNVDACIFMHTNTICNLKKKKSIFCVLSLAEEQFFL